MRFILSLMVLICFVACSKNKETLKVGVTNGPHAQIVEFVQKKAQKEGLKVEIVYFDDFIQPNIALDAKDIDANIYQHEPFLYDQMKSRGYKFKSLGRTILLPLGIYPNPAIKSFDDVKKGAKVLIPIDPTNSARALKLLEKSGLIDLSNHIDPSPRDVNKNPRELKIIEVEAPLIPRLLLDDADLGVINADWVIVSQIDPKTALLKESSDSANYTNLMVVREEDKARPDLKKFLNLYQSQDVADFIAETFKGVVDPQW